MHDRQVTRTLNSISKSCRLLLTPKARIEDSSTCGDKTSHSVIVTKFNLVDGNGKKDVTIPGDFKINAKTTLKENPPMPTYQDLTVSLYKR